jgi:exodeoxyribonuclease V alpha subunit
MELDESQRKAVESAKQRGLRIINGGAGFGKTTIVKNLAAELKAEREPVYLCAFAGKAAARLREATGFNASTIHRMLGCQGDSNFTLGNLKGVTVICDEASMVSSDLMAEIVKRGPKRLILVGDEAQLPPVGSGQPFHDLIALRPDLVSTLTTCYRNQEAIFKASMKIRRGEMPLGHDKTPGETWTLKGVGAQEATHQWICDLVKAGEVDFAKDIIICPRNGESEKQLATVEALNLDLAQIVNPRTGDEKLKVLDRVINTVNQPNIDCWNGTTGHVHAIDTDGGVWVKLDVPVVDYEKTLVSNETVYRDTVLFKKAQAKALKLAYALTVHKSQGSQYRKVWFVCLCRDQFALVDRSLIYTAITRAREECTVIGEIRALQDGIRTVRTKQTVIQELNRQTTAA